MKLTDLHKNKGLKINSGIKHHASNGIPGTDLAPPDRREQRKLDQARGLIPFACKLESTLVAQLRSLAEERKVELNDLVAELLHAGLQGGETPAKKPAAKAAKAEKAEKA